MGNNSASLRAGIMAHISGWVSNGFVSVSRRWFARQNCPQNVNKNSQILKEMIDIIVRVKFMIFMWKQVKYKKVIVIVR